MSCTSKLVSKSSATACGAPRACSWAEITPSAALNSSARWRKLQGLLRWAGTSSSGALHCRAEIFLFHTYPQKQGQQDQHGQEPEHGTEQEQPPPVPPGAADRLRRRPPSPSSSSVLKISTPKRSSRRTQKLLVMPVWRTKWALWIIQLHAFFRRKQHKITPSANRAGSRPILKSLKSSPRSPGSLKSLYK